MTQDFDEWMKNNQEDLERRFIEVYQEEFDKWCFFEYEGQQEADADYLLDYERDKKLLL